MSHLHNKIKISKLTNYPSFKIINIIFFKAFVLCYTNLKKGLVCMCVVYAECEGKYMYLFFNITIIILPRAIITLIEKRDGKR